MKHTTLFLIALLSGGVVTRRAHAQSQPAEIEAQHQHGMRLRDQHRDEEARALFQQIWEHTHEARALARLALAEQAVGRRADAEAHLVQALAMREEPWIQQNRAVLEGALQQARAAQGISMIEVSSNVTSAEVFLNGARIGVVGEPVRTSPGVVSFELRARGYTTVARTITLSPGETRHETVSLVVATDAAVTGGAEGRAPRSASAHEVTPSAHEPRRVGSTLRTLAWVSGATAVAMLGVGVVGYVVSGDAASRWNDDAQCLPPMGTRESACGSDRETAEAIGAMSVAGFVGAGLLGVTSAVLFVLSPTRLHERSMNCGSGPGTVGVSCVVRF